jgi:hypothetical protein
MEGGSLNPSPSLLYRFTLLAGLLAIMSMLTA